MIEWNEQQQMIQKMVRDFVAKEVVPNLDDIEYNGVPPYDILRKMIKTFGMDVMATQNYEKQIAREKAAAENGEDAPTKKKDGPSEGAGDQAAMTMIPIIELSRHAQGLVTAMGVSMGLTGGAIMSKGTIEQKERWALPLLTLEKVGAWAISEPNSGSDAFGQMKTLAKRDGNGGYIINGSKTWITNGPYADTIVLICKLDEEGVEPKDRKIVSFILDAGMEGLEQSKPFKKMGIGSSPTGELFFSDLKVGADRLLGGSETSYGRSGAKATFMQERAGVAAMALGMVERALELSTAYARDRAQFGRPIGDNQLIQLKLAKMEVARANLQNMVFRYIEMTAAGKQMSLAEASAMKLYAAQTAMEVSTEAVQVHGGYGYMRESRVEQLMRDAKILQIYAGTDEMQIIAIARDLLGRG
ncbi:MAG: acyl-CoA dehydrogenase family protein [Alloalcanivorax venustensis]|jgi:alkylation response protein AidB-like acyl-CoA dehydrogenase|uniref:acyl-CoA dehydrogenase family protein n=1 Tax=Alloalcanivorax venustensis TaxID=172371 RepID=UPI000C8DC61F|nr:acyl-CoA dehydrogenase [Alcanivorax sp.]MEC8880915.1 acyl-CoA dehydrogenase family protein [Pseudomonadota bacterium]QVL42532.1 MAG: acyl-CoA dehydrogenase family protein [Alcanivorax sp.]HAB05203.1 acyl-CoA dehydrogenase [Alcanivorax sp.]HAJ41758.1 acyl-CoA dehydrogenase [Alcanivorax sp.]|tara:strand:+ start:16215 stop:17459 length:1245 start_codon:yes stop_codon:yes gene_type:complete